MERYVKIYSPVEAAGAAIEKLEEARSAVKRVVEVRAVNKLSFSRAANVAKEISDLIKVMSVYCREQVITKM